MRVFIAGSMKIRYLDPLVKRHIDRLLANDYEIVMGDADGADTLVQSYLFNRGAKKTTVYCSGLKPRNNVGNWPVQRVDTKHAEGSRAFFTAKDIRMAEMADMGLMIWDAESTGTLGNIIELLMRKKQSTVFVNKARLFKDVANVKQLEEILSFMSEAAKEKGNKKIKLFSRIESLKHEQLMFMMPMGH